MALIFGRIIVGFIALQAAMSILMFVLIAIITIGSSPGAAFGSFLSALLAGAVMYFAITNFQDMSKCANMMS